MGLVLESKKKVEDVYVFASPSTQLKNQPAKRRHNLNALGLDSSLD